jgi:hypothetical protein
MDGTQIVPHNGERDWHYTVSLSLGLNTFIFDSIDRAGNQSSIDVVIITRTEPADEDSGDEEGDEEPGNPSGDEDGQDEVQPLPTQVPPINPTYVPPVQPTYVPPVSPTYIPPVTPTRTTPPSQTVPLPNITSPVIPRPTPARCSEKPQNDSDGDEIDDDWERRYFDDLGVLDRGQDFDGDGLTDDEEYCWQTDPTNYDTDGDGLSDGEEVHLYGTNPLVPDTDTDMSDDGHETQLGTNPLDNTSRLPDTDSDGIADQWVRKFFEFVAPGYDLSLHDTDGDGLSDLEEYFRHTNPTNADTDGDGTTDGDEIYVFGTNPLDPSNNPETQGVFFVNLQNLRYVSDSTPITYGKAPRRGTVEIRAFPVGGTTSLLLGEVRANARGEFVLHLYSSLASGSYVFRGYLIGTNHQVYKKSPSVIVNIKTSLGIDPPIVDELGGRRLANVILSELNLLLDNPSPLMVGRALEGSEVSVIWAGSRDLMISYADASSDTAAFESAPPRPLPSGKMQATVYLTSDTGVRSREVIIPFQVIAGGPLYSLLSPLTFSFIQMPQGLSQLVVAGFAAAILLILILFGGMVREYLKKKYRRLVVVWRQQRENYAVLRFIQRVKDSVDRFRQRHRKYKIKRDRDKYKQS